MDTQSWRDEQRKLREAVRASGNSATGGLQAGPREEIAPLSLAPPDLLATPIVSQRGAPGHAIVVAKRLLRRLLAPFVLEPQTAFNQALVQALTEQRELLASLAASSATSQSSVQAQGPPLDYLGFEQRFRGSAESIESRQAEYLDYLSERGEVLDIGCGRGELLAMLQARGTSARGVDVDEDMVAHCREQGLRVECEDAVEFLDRHPDGFFGAIFMSQVVEHLTTDYLVTLLDAIGRKTAKDAVLIIETINPESLPVLMRWFWLDPTHVRLVHPETLQYFMEQAGFQIKTVQFRNEVPSRDRFPALQLDGVSAEALASFNESVESFNAQLFGLLDYFVVGQSEA